MRRIDELELVQADDFPRRVEDRRDWNRRRVAVEAPRVHERPDRGVEAAVARVVHPLREIEQSNELARELDRVGAVLRR
jgi:hypothetical protein